jgi:triacylglycerol lipase
LDAARGAGAGGVAGGGTGAGGVGGGVGGPRDGGAVAKARRVITLGAPLHGTRTAAAAAAESPDSCPPGCRQLATGSAELAELARARVGQALPWLSIWTADDQTVVPPDSARLDGAVNVEVQDVCPGARVQHGQLPTDGVVTGLVLRALGADPLTATGDCAAVRAAGTR